MARKRFEFAESNATIVDFHGWRVAEAARCVSQGVRNGERKSGVQDGHSV
jgi:hypothetical protein